MIGGKIEEGGSPLEAAIRESHEELGDEAIFEDSLFELIMEFDEIATSDGKTPIHFYVFNIMENYKENLLLQKKFNNLDGILLKMVLKYFQIL